VSYNQEWASKTWSRETGKQETTSDIHSLNLLLGATNSAIILINHRLFQKIRRQSYEHVYYMNNNFLVFTILFLDTRARQIEEIGKVVGTPHSGKSSANSTGHRSPLRKTD
jgi:hypothetical protein